MKTRNKHARDVRVENRGALAEREAADRADGVAAEPLERQQRFLVARQGAVEPRDRFARDRLQPLRADVVAERPPRLADVVFVRRRRALRASETARATRGTSAARDPPASAAASPRRRGCDTDRRSRARAAAVRARDTSQQRCAEPAPRAGRGSAARRGVRVGCRPVATRAVCGRAPRTGSRYNRAT